MSYYVYGHFKNDTNEIFYVGKGQDDRAYVTEHRNPYWINVVNKHGYKVKILFYFDHEKLAFSTEKYLIKKIGRHDLKMGPLANMTDGGEGASGYKHTDKTKAIISEKNSGENAYQNGKTLEELHGEDAVSIKQKMSDAKKDKTWEEMHGREKAKKMRYKRAQLTGKNSPNHNRTIYHWHHPVHGNRICTRIELRKEFSELRNKALRHLIKHVTNQYKEWRLVTT
jgi:hypothetical protein